MPFDLDAFRSDVLSDPLVQDVWNNKYRWKRSDNTKEDSVIESQYRVIEAIMGHESSEIMEEARFMIYNGYFLPAGRQNAGAGTGRNVTLQNCYVGDTIQDSMPGIQLAIAKSAFTLQQGGGIGNDFSTVRPAGALVRRTGSVSSGSIRFMNQMSTMSDTVCSAGERRGAMMTTLADWHADLWREDQFETTANYTGDQVYINPSFISAKREKGKLTQTNISVLVSDAFMQAVEADADWDLGHWYPRADGNHIAVYDRPFPYDYVELNNDFKEFFLSEDIQGRRKGEMLPFYVYTRVKARRIWNDIMASTFKFAEPGVIFIDRINQRNNLNYCEDIRCTNPCGEQPLPPFGTCCLGSINVAFMVKDPFTPQAHFDMPLYKRAIHLGIRFLDNVLDISKYPLEEQRKESMNKRRIGLGITGVADALLQMGQTYGSEQAVLTAQHLGIILQQESYRASSKLAVERGSFPAYDRDKFMESPNVKRLPVPLQIYIADKGMRNGVLNTVAPNGTISIYSGNTGQGIEPVLTFQPTIRKVRQPDSSLKEMVSLNYSHRLWNELHPGELLPDYFVSALGDKGGGRAITPEVHIRMQAAFQESIDASISKTVNCPVSMTIEEFEQVYKLAYDLGCKGCTTYRNDPDAGRGSVLSIEGTDVPADGIALSVNFEEPAPRTELKPAQRVVDARRYKLKWPMDGSNWYVTITRHDNEPFEVFITTAGADNAEWVQALSRLLTAILRRGGDVKFLVNELSEVHSARGGAHIKEQRKFRPSIVAAIGGILEEEFRALGIIDPPGHTDLMIPPESIDALLDKEAAEAWSPQTKVVPVTVTYGSGPDSCPECHATPIVHEQGCRRCLSCDWNECS